MKCSLDYFNRAEFTIPENRTHGILRLVDCKQRTIIIVDDNNRLAIEKESWCAYSHCWDEEINYSFTMPGVDWDVNISSYKMDSICNIALQLGYDYCWIDNLCINQSDNNEKALVIPAMNSIYGNNDCIAILKSINAQDIDNFYDVWDNFEKYKYLIGDEISVRKLDDDGKVYIQSMAGVLETIFKDRWFTRVWTMQEVVLPKKFVFSTYDGRIIHRSMLEDLSSFYMVLEIAKRDRIININMDNFMTYKEVIVLKEHIWTNSLSDVIRLLANRTATKEEDYVYGLLGLCSKNVIANMPVTVNIGFKNAFLNLIHAGISVGDVTLLCAKTRRGLCALPQIQIGIYNNFNPGLCSPTTAVESYQNYNLVLNGNIRTAKLKLITKLLDNHIGDTIDILGRMVHSRSATGNMLSSAAFSGAPISAVTENAARALDCHGRNWGRYQNVTEDFLVKDDMKYHLSLFLRLLKQQIGGWCHSCIWLAKVEREGIGTGYVLINVDEHTSDDVYAIDIGVKYKDINVYSGLIVPQLHSTCMRRTGMFCSISGFWFTPPIESSAIIK